MARYLAFALALLSAGPATADIIVDDFAQGAISVGLSHQPTTQRSLDTNTVLGGTRTIRYSGASNPGSPQYPAIVDISGGGTFSIGGSLPSTGAEGPQLEYGVSNFLPATNSIDPLDLNLNVFQRPRLVMDFLYYVYPERSNQPNIVAVTLFHQGQAGSPDTFEALPILFHSSPTPFTTTLFLTGSAGFDLSDVDGLAILFGAPASTSFSLQSIHIFPEPSSFVLLAAGAAVVAFWRWLS